MQEAAAAALVEEVLGSSADPPTTRVILCWAQSLDGAIAQDPAGRYPTLLTTHSLPAHRLVHEIRARVDAIVVGVGTILSDDPRLTARSFAGDTREKQPHVVIMDPQLRCPPTARVFSAAPASARSVTLVTTTAHAKERAQLLEAAGARLMIAPRATRLFDLERLISELGATHGWRRLMVEGGAHTLASWQPHAHAMLTLVAPVFLGVDALRVPWRERAVAPQTTEWHAIDPAEGIAALLTLY